ncbi:MAG: hypothetical protein ACTJLL_02940 [Anaplasma sp.]
MMDFSEGTYDISISCGSGPLCAGDCKCDAEFPAVTFERYGDGSYSFYERISGEWDRPCAGVNTPFSIYGLIEDINGVPVVRSVSYSDVPCQVGSGNSSLVSREVGFFNVVGVRNEDGSIVFHSDALGADLIVKPSAKAAHSYDDVVNDDREEVYTYYDYGLEAELEAEAEDVNLSADADEVSTVETTDYEYFEDFFNVEDDESLWDVSENYGEEEVSDLVEDEHRAYDETTTHVTAQEPETAQPTDSQVAHPEPELVASYEDEPEQLGDNLGETEVTEEEVHSDYHAEEAEEGVQVSHLEEELAGEHQQEETGALEAEEESEYHHYTDADAHHTAETDTVTFAAEEAVASHEVETQEMAVEEAEETEAVDNQVQEQVAEVAEEEALGDYYVPVTETVEETETVTLAAEEAAASHEVETQEMAVEETEAVDNQVQEQVAEVAEEEALGDYYVPVTEAEPTVVAQEQEYVEEETSSPEEHTVDVHVPAEETAIAAAPSVEEEEASIAQAEAEEEEDEGSWWKLWW